MNNDKYLKISFVGDIMCELPQLKASKKKDNYNFDEMFNNTKYHLKKSDIVVGNLETPITRIGGYTNDLYSFNTPYCFLESIKKGGFDILNIANNHCLDRGIKGLNDTMKNIKKAKMKYVGANQINENKRYKVIEKDGIKISFISYTYGTNYSYNYYKLNKTNLKQINLLKNQISNVNWKIYKSNLKFYELSLKRRVVYNLKKVLNYKKTYQFDPKKSIVVDKLGVGEWIIDKEILTEIKKIINEAKSESDIVVLLLHTGGQFNSDPGTFSKYIFDELKKEKVNLIIGSHPHIVQKSEIFNQKLLAYSLGNYSISPSTPYLNNDLLPCCSVLLNIYIDKKSKTIKKQTFSILKSVEDNNHYLRVYFMNELIEKEKDIKKKNNLISENLLIYNRFLNKSEKNIERLDEYEIEVSR